MITLEVLNVGDITSTSASLDDLDHYIADPDNLVWIDVTSPSKADIELLAREFQFHPLALEDAQTRHLRPKIDQYNSFIFIVFYAMRATGGDPIFVTQEVMMFIGSNYLITVHGGDCPEIDQTAHRWQENAAQLRSRHVAILLYSLLDTIVDNYFPVLDAVADRIDHLEEQIFEDGSREALEEIFRLRKGLLALRRILSPERDLMNTLTRRDIELLGPETAVYFQDIFDHVLRVSDAVDTYRDLLASALDAYLSVVSNNLNQVMRTLTSWSIILMSLALIAGIYGMNFAFMPELEFRWGYFAVLGAMLAIALALIMMFRKIRWL